MANTIVMYKFWDTRNLYHPKWNWGLFKHNDGFFMESEAYHIELPENVVLAENKFGETRLFLVEKDKATMCQLDVFSSPKGSCPLLVGPDMYKYLKIIGKVNENENEIENSKNDSLNSGNIEDEEIEM